MILFVINNKQALFLFGLLCLDFFVCLFDLGFFRWWGLGREKTAVCGLFDWFFCIF